MWFTRISIGNPVMAVMLMLAFVVLGLFSVQRLKVDQFPNVEFPTVVISTAYPGASPEIVEIEVTRKIEEAVNTIAGISQLNSRSYEGMSVVIVQFNLDVESRKAAEDVREKIGLTKTTFKDEVQEPKVQRFDPTSRPVVTVALTATDHSRSAIDLSTIADQIVKRRLENVRGVGSVTLVGARQREIQVRLRPAAMEALGVSVDQIASALKGDIRDLPAGTLRNGEKDLVVQVLAAPSAPRDLAKTVVARRGSAGTPIRLSQVAEIIDGPQDLQSLALYNGQRTVMLDVVKNQGDNTVEVVDGLNRAVAELPAVLPKGVKADVVRDSSRPIRVAVGNVQRTLIEGAALTILIVFLFLNSWRSTIITGLTLPIALVGTFFFMQILGFSLNMVTLMAMSLCVGLLIDDAIVVRENIVRHVQMGKPPRQAALDGTQEIGLAVLATTLSIVAVFLPIGFMGGIIGKFFHEFGITIVAAVMISMFVSFTLDPMLSSVWHDPAIDREGQPFIPRSVYDHSLGRITHAFDRAQHLLGRAYVRILAWSLRHKLATVAVALASLMGSFALIPVLGTEFVPKADYSETSVIFYTPTGSSIEVTEERARQVDALLRQQPEVKYTLTTINSGQVQGRNYATVYARLVDRQQRQRNVDQMSEPLREQLRAIPGITVTHVGLLDGVSGQKPLSLSIQGPDLQELQRLSDQLVAEMARIPGLIDLDSSLKTSKPTLSVQIDRQAAADAGLGVGQITSHLRTLLEGETVGQWRSGAEQVHDIRLSLAPEDRARADQLGQLRLQAGPLSDGSSRTVRLDQVADIRASLGAQQINRRDLNREVELSANTVGRSLGEVSAEVKKVLDKVPLPAGYTARLGGSTKDMQESFGYALSALAMAVIFIYMILASQFRSFIQPISLMSSLPLTLIGVVLALLAWRSTLNMFSIIGVIMLMGLVTKNAILLVDFANRARAEGLDRTTALLDAARVRLRPILMTTLAMVFGMVPLAFALTEGSEQRAPMGQAVIGGVITSSLLTLVVVPVIYVWLDDLSAWFRRLWQPASTAVTSTVEHQPDA